MTRASGALAKDDVGNILTSLGIERRHIVPTNASQRILRQQSKFNQFESEIPYFPLEWFDCDNESGGNESKFFAGTHSAEGIYLLCVVFAHYGLSWGCSRKELMWEGNEMFAAKI